MKKQLLMVLGMIVIVSGCGVREEMPFKVSLLFSQLDKSAEKEQVYRDWKAQHPSPVIEKNRVTFLFWDKTATQVVLESSVIKNKEGKQAMKRYKNTPLWWLSLPLKEERLIDYSFLFFDENTPNGRRILDPFLPYVAYTKPMMTRFVLPGEKIGRLVVTNYKPKNGLAGRKIFVYLPWDYDQTTNRYPVIYMQDGQNLWDSKLANFGGWKVDTTLDRLIREEKIQPVIVVGIENSSARAEEYVGFSAYYKWKEPYDTNEQKRLMEYSMKYLDFVVNDLRPWVEQHYRVSSRETAVAGSSFGAGISLFLGLSRPDVFQSIGAFSFGNYRSDDVNRGIRRVLQVQPYLSDRLIAPTGKNKIYLDCGGKGIDVIFVEASRKLHQDFLKKGWKEEQNYLYVEDPKADHNEMAWAFRFERFALFLWGK